MNNNKIEKIVIVGGGTAGWMAAAALAKAFKSKGCNITLVESAAIGTIGVGEATIPPILNFLKYLEIDEVDFIRHTQGTFKLAIKFEDWLQKGSSFYHPFGAIGVNIDGLDFFPFFQKYNQSQTPKKYTDFSQAAQMCEAGTFYWPQKASKDSFVAGVNYALHIDAGLAAKYLRGYAVSKSVTRIEGDVVAVNNRQNGFISSIEVKNQGKIEADFFIDCSGFKGLLIEKSLTAGYSDWSDYLPCNRAVAVQTKTPGIAAPYTLATAKDHGWRWKIPLQHRSGNGYVYCSDYCSDEEALHILLQDISGEIVSEPKVIPFVTGHRRQIWKNNCLSLGLASGFVEPLESTAIHLIAKGIRAFLDLLPEKGCDLALVKEYNRIMLREYESIRDFIVLHYCTTQREDTAFWLRCKNMSIPCSLQEKIALFKARGSLYFDPSQLFNAPSWYCLFNGMGVEAGAYDPLVDESNFKEVERILHQVEPLMKKVAHSLPSHQAFLAKYCPAL